MRLNNRIYLPAVSSVIAGIWIIVGLIRYGWWIDGRPTSGFFPILVGFFLLFVSVLALIGEGKSKPVLLVFSHFYALIAALGVVLVALLIGFFPALTIYVFGWLKVYEKYRLRFSLLATILTIGVMYGIFVLWLKVPFPKGYIIDLVLG